MGDTIPVCAVCGNVKMNMGEPHVIDPAMVPKKYRTSMFISRWRMPVGLWTNWYVRIRTKPNP